MKYFSLILAGLILISLWSASHAKGQRQEDIVRTQACNEHSVYSSVNTENMEEPGGTYRDYSQDLFSERTAYHRHLNGSFEKNISAMTATIQAVSKEIAENGTIAKSRVDEIVKEHEVRSTWNLAEELLCSFEKYTLYIRDRSSRYEVAHLDEATKISDEVLRAYFRRNEWSSEIEFSRKALDRALAIHDSMHSTYLLHVQYRVLISELAIFRRQLDVLAKLVSCLPSKFVNASTTQCQ